ncbi:MAG: Asp-tRNA(Asn)/Glu-tRNA(Gln) amidotransferase subunit GatC [Oligoflexia bacterium]|nr:Asp-tRNA(Asn)/Glu-tRNA(Gln) amidotransferase subunit GatC [Oligoflexia bacterium]
MISNEDVKKLALLARLNLSEPEAQRLHKDLNSILGYMERLQKVDVSKVDPMSHVHGATNVFREDELKPSLPVEAALELAPDHSGRFIRVPIVIDQGGEN